MPKFSSFRYPASREIKIEQYLSVESPAMKARIAELEKELYSLKEKAPEVRELVVEKVVEKEVPIQDKALLDRLNAAEKELGEFRGRVHRGQMPTKIVEKIVEKEVPKVEYVDRIVPVQTIKTKFIVAATSAAAALGYLLGHFF